jgi:hypothetical protein
MVGAREPNANDARWAANTNSPAHLTRSLRKGRLRHDKPTVHPYILACHVGAQFLGAEIKKRSAGTTTCSP